MPDPMLSSDATIGRLARRHVSLLAEATRLDVILATYASRPEHAPSVFPVVSALDHYPMSEGAECGCDTCAEWGMRREEFIRVTRLVPKGHKWSTCACGTCRFVGRIQLNFLAATNRRDLLIETSFHARYHSPFGVHVMAWLETEMTNPRYTVNWCAQEMNRYPLEWWLRRCENAVGPVVSGIVFRDAMHVTDARVHFGSSLVADGYLAL